MKVLFAVNNESISETIIKKYQKMFDELLEYKNVYYYNAIVKEIQNDKTYDIIVISEDLETISASDKSRVDSFILDKLEMIVNVFKVEEIPPIPILFISNEKRVMKDEIIPNMFNLGIYDALVGKDRTITKICELINNPRTEEQARAYYNLGTVGQPGLEKEIVNLKEINNILRHYKKISQTPDRFSSSFDRIAAQYDDIQLKYIIDKLPEEVKEVLKQQNSKYQEMLNFKREEIQEIKPGVTPEIKPEVIPEIKPEPQKTSNVVIPQEISKTNIVSQTKVEPIIEPVEEKAPEVVVPKIPDVEEAIKVVEETIEEEPEIVLPVEEEVKEEIEVVQEKEIKEEVKIPTETLQKDDSAEIVIEGIEDDDLDIFGDLIEDEDDDFIPIFTDVGLEDEIEESDEDIKVDTIVEEPKVEQVKDDIDIFDDELLLDDDVEFIPTLDLGVEESIETPVVEESIVEEVKEEPVVLKTEEKVETIEKVEPIVEEPIVPIKEDLIIPIIEEPIESTETIKPQIDIFAEKAEKEKELVVQNKKDFVVPDLSSVLSKDKKVVIFVGTSKNGTSFLVNSLGMMFASIGINTAILDMTKNRNSYYLSTKNDERLRQVAIESIKKLREGVAMGVDVVRGLTVYTALPGEQDTFSDSQSILSTLIKNYSLVLIDADFNTNFGYFSAAQEIYLVQSLDVLTIQPLTAFLKELLDAGVLTTEKVKVVLNKEVAVRGLTRKILVGGLSTYNDPAMSIMTNLFDRNQVQVASIPFDQNVYSKYLENIVECKYDISGYPKKFVEALKVLANMVYPLISKQRDVSLGGGIPAQPQMTSNPFTNDMSSTLDQMRRRL